MRVYRVRTCQTFPAVVKGFTPIRTVSRREWICENPACRLVLGTVELFVLGGWRRAGPGVVERRLAKRAERQGGRFQTRGAVSSTKLQQNQHEQPRHPTPFQPGADLEMACREYSRPLRTAGEQRAVHNKRRQFTRRRTRRWP